MSSILLRTDNLCKTFSNAGIMQHVLRSVSVSVHAGEFLVIMGASGAGKTTLLYALSGMDTPTIGNVWFQDEKISDFSTDELAMFRRAHCGFVFQQPHLIDSMSVADNILAAGLLKTRDRKALMRRITELFRSVDLDEAAAGKFPAQLSGGEAQRAGMVRALINDPELLFADEPTGALNSQMGRDVLDTLTQFNEQGQTIVMVTHDLGCARRASRILYLRDGSLTGECDLGQYVHADQMRHEKVLAFLAEMGW